MFKINQFFIFGIIIMMLLMSCTLRETQLGEELEQKGDWDGAVAAYREALRKEPFNAELEEKLKACLLYTSPSPRDGLLSRMPSSA